MLLCVFAISFMEMKIKKHDKVSINKRLSMVLDNILFSYLCAKFFKTGNII